MTELLPDLVNDLGDLIFHAEDQFKIEELFKARPKIKLIVDLTKNLRTYAYGLKTSFDVNYVHLPCSLPISDEIYGKFRSIYLEFQEKNPDKYIGVHCLTGDEETKAMICKFLELEFGIDGVESEQIFNRARFPFKK